MSKVIVHLKPIDISKVAEQYGVSRAADSKEPLSETVKMSAIVTPWLIVDAVQYCLGRLPTGAIIDRVEVLDS
jgi:hypothetical protein